MEDEGDSNSDPNEDTEPQIASSNAEERKLARRLRIQRRVEALLKQKQREENQLQVEEEVEKSSIEKQIEKSLEFLEQLIIDGDEHLTNVRIANEARETDRREREGFGREKLLNELEEEATKAADMFNEIATKWSGILKYNDPLHINEDIQGQKEKCDDLVKQKDEIIATLKAHIRNAEINFGIDQRRQIGDVNSLARRIENQIVAMRKAYRQELLMIEEVIMSERQLLIEANSKKWEDFAKKRDQEERFNAEKRTEDYWDFVKDMDNLNRDFKELYRETNIKLENDCDELQRELERIKAEAAFNSEKLDYNYQILKKREDENLIIRSQQKRRINKLQDAVNALRKKINDYQTDTSTQIGKLNQEIKKLQNSILDIEDKADHLAKVNDKKFEQVWEMNNERANELYSQILKIDKIFYEQQLGIEWQRPQDNPPTKESLVSYTSAVAIVEDEKSKIKRLASNTDMLEAEDKMNANNRRVVKKILGLICDKTGFLMEDQIYQILKPYLEDEQTLVKADNVFEALNVTQKEDIELLYSHFLPYMFCPICNSQTARLESLFQISRISIMDMGSRKSTLTDFADIGGVDTELVGTPIQIGPLTITIFDENLKGECKGPGDAFETNEEVSEASSIESIIRERMACKQEHPLVINSVYVLKALREFLAKYHTAKASMPTMSARLSHERRTVSRLISSSDIEMFWRTFTEIFPQDKEDLWDGLEQGLKKYHILLQDRKTVSEEVVSLRRQNNDLRKLFTNYIRENPLPYD